MRTVVARVAQVPHIDGPATLQELGIGSLAFIRLVIDLERACGVSFDDEDIDAVKFVTVDDLVSYVLRKS